MQVCNIISKDEDLVGAVKVDWDVDGYDIYRIEGFPHSIGGRWGENCYYAIDKDDEFKAENLISFSGHPVCWGYRIEQKNTIKVKWDTIRMNGHCRGVITRNGEDFYETGGSLDYLSHYLPHLLIVIQEQVPVFFSSPDFREELIGRNVKYELNEGLKKFFNMSTNPIPHYTKKRGYQTLFAIKSDRQSFDMK